MERFSFDLEDNERLMSEIEPALFMEYFRDIGKDPVATRKAMLLYTMLVMDMAPTKPLCAVITLLISGLIDKDTSSLDFALKLEEIVLRLVEYYGDSVKSVMLSSFMDMMQYTSILGDIIQKNSIQEIAH